ncbi:MAG: hypothetical protein QOF44_2037 [Streptomyces sp.]|nr:hypothetical protein [Streptomyces sp.]
MSDRIFDRTRPAASRTRAVAGRVPRALPWLAGVSVAYVLVQLALVVPGTGLGWDETVYTSQVSGSVPAAFFSAPRARGITFLAAPVAELTRSTLALRVWMALLSGAGLFVALWVWRKLLPVRVLVLAGGLFAGLWITLYYGPQVMPNLWDAYGVLLAVGCFLRAARDRGDRTALVGLAAGVAVAGLMRPPDAVWLAMPLVGAALLVREWRRPALVAVVAVGLVLGCGEWVVEAFVRYGGLAERLRLGSDIQGGMGRHFAVDDQIRALDGRALCRPCDIPWRHRITSVWFFALPVPAVAGAVAARRAGRRATALLPLVVAAFLAVPYLFLIDYAAPRFLLPAYALLALPVADCLWWVVTGPGGRLRLVAATLVAVALCGHLAVQFSVLTRTVHDNRLQRAVNDSIADRLRQAGVRPPCMITGDSSVLIAFYSGCASREMGGADASITPDGVRAMAGHKPVAVLVKKGRQPPAFAREWRVVQLRDGAPFRGYRAYVSA